MSDTTEQPEFDLEVDAAGLKCPLPILRAKKALAQLQSGQVLKVITTDPHAVRDFQAFSKQTGNGLLAQVEDAGNVVHFLSRR
ncbi:sulfurtransferase TusA family protein [Pusillimonas sp.]|uniref:sulfurtransferase TusA family protein n=1 Tax=Pusillimonas sp. TaxID=3040095 RepID=UPI0029B36873|nr:sulfurtransferase TusA family protein [Pusillimonas sp.]MDX3896060.1 sulfurtransferase TusA family protein [Pusillimonas sp.]